LNRDGVHTMARLDDATAPHDHGQRIHPASLSDAQPCGRARNLVWSRIIDQSIVLPVPDYEAVDILIVDEPQQLRALAGESRLRIVALLRERAASTTELAAELRLAKGTIGHHLKVLEEAGLVRVVRTRQVRAMTERFYGRVARLFLIKGAEEDEALAHVRVRLDAADARRFERRVGRLVRDIEACDSGIGEEYALVIGLHRTGSHT